MPPAKLTTDILIIGAGPAGLGTAERLQELDAEWLLVERENHVGGLASGFEKDGFTWDLGGHVIFSHYDRYDQMLDRVIPADEWIRHERVSYIRIRDRWIPYPFQTNIWKLPAAERWRCLKGVIRLYTEDVTPDLANFQTFIDTHFGEGIATLFMNPYNFKVWGYPPEEMSSDWIGERVARVDLEEVAKNMIYKKCDVSWGPNNMFRFPLRGGTGEIWHRLAGDLPTERIMLNSEVVRVSTERNIVELASGGQVEYDRLISTIPLEVLIACADTKELDSVVQGLRHSSVHVVGLGIEGAPPGEISDFCWMYFPENNCPFYRATLFSNYSPQNAPDRCWSLMLETSETPRKPVTEDDIVADCIDGCRACNLLLNDADVVSTWHRKVEYGYPTPTKDRDDRLASILSQLEARNIYSRGRFGAWQYEVGNMDHSYMQGVDIANRVLRGTDETVVRYPS